MADIATTLNDLESKIQTAVGSSVTVAKRTGDPKEAQSSPAIYVRYYGSQCGNNEEIGAVCYRLETVWEILIHTADTSTADGDDAAAILLEQCREALNGQVIGGLGVANPHPVMDGMSEFATEIAAGHYGYVQYWSIEQIVG